MEINSAMNNKPNNRVSSNGNHRVQKSAIGNANLSKIKGIQIKNFNKVYVNSFAVDKACYSNSDRIVNYNKKV